MNEGRFVFSQLMDFLPKYEFDKCVKRWKGNHRVRNFSCYDQYLCMAFAQLTSRSSLRDLVTCLNAFPEKLYHCGLRGKIALSTLAKANEKRSCKIYRDFAMILIQEAKRLYAAEEFGAQLDQSAYALDATVIDLCLSLFPWAKFRKKKSAVKIHTLLDLHGNVPSLVFITSGAIHDVNILDKIPLEADAIYVMDRAYVDFERLYKFNQKSATFITRAKKNLDYRRLYSHPVDKESGLRSDQTIRLNGFYASKDYPDNLRRIHYVNPQTHKRLVFLTNSFDLPALSVTDLYRCRWQIELFFKWIKQHLRIKSFFGTTENAVKTQIWIAISVYVLVAIVKKKLHCEKSLYTILQILSVTIFEKTPILQVLQQEKSQTTENPACIQLNLLDF